jgi:hypothetical protein
LFSWRYNPLWLYFHSLVAGFSLKVFEVSWSHTTTCHSWLDSSGRVINLSQRPLSGDTALSEQVANSCDGDIAMSEHVANVINSTLTAVMWS